MDINKEREAFERFKAEKIGIAYDELKTDLDDCERRFSKRYAGWNFSDDWELWQAAKAQAVPEGFVLVPIDTLEECLGWAHIAKWDSPSKEVDNEIAHHESIIESIIDAQEPAND